VTQDVAAISANTPSQSTEEAIEAEGLISIVPADMEAADSIMGLRDRSLWAPRDLSVLGRRLKPSGPRGRFNEAQGVPTNRT
jgi:hypothetical protein